MTLAAVRELKMADWLVANRLSWNGGSLFRKGENLLQAVSREA